MQQGLEAGQIDLREAIGLFLIGLRDILPAAVHGKLADADPDPVTPVQLLSHLQRIWRRFASRALNSIPLGAPGNWNEARPGIRPAIQRIRSARTLWISARSVLLGGGLVVEVLRVVRLGEEVPPLGQQAEVLHGEGRQQQ